MNNVEKFLQVLYEAPGDPPDLGGTGPPDMPNLAADSPTPPDMPDLGGGDMPPDLGDDNFGMGTDDQSMMGYDQQQQQDPNNPMNMELDEKISAIMNQQLYSRYLALLNTITDQLSSIKNNSDILFSVSKESVELIDKFKKLDENVRLYIKNSFLHENYSKNLLFFNKCLNLLKLLNDEFDRVIRKGIRSQE